MLYNLIDHKSNTLKPIYMREKKAVKKAPANIDAITNTILEREKHDSKLTTLFVGARHNFGPVLRLYDF